MEPFRIDGGHEKVTIYAMGDFGNIVKREGKLIRHGRMKYAQYPAAPYVEFIPSGKRKPRCFISGYDPFLLILKGDGHPDPESWLVPAGEFGGFLCSQSRYTACDSRYKTDFNRAIAKYLESFPEGTILGDYRANKSVEEVANA